MSGHRLRPPATSPIADARGFPSRQLIGWMERVTAALANAVGITDLGFTPGASSGTITSSTGNDTTIPAVDGTNAGLMVPAMKTKLDGVEDGATRNIGALADLDTVDLAYAASAADGVVTSSVGADATVPLVSVSAAGLLGPNRNRSIRANPLEYGAAGDGTTDDTTAVASMLAAEKNVEIPEGRTFLISSTLSPQAGTTIRGRGTIRAANGLNGNLFALSGKSGVHFDGFTLDGNRANQTAGSGFNITGCSDISIRNLRLVNIFHNGILSDETTNFDYSHNTLDGCGNHGISLSGDGTAGTTEHNYGTVASNLIIDADRSGVNVSESRHVSVTGNVCRYTGTHSGGEGGIRCSNGSSHISVIGNVVQNWSRGIFLIHSRDCTVVGNTLEDCRQQGIFIDSGAGGASLRNTITANVVRSPGRSGSDTEGVFIRSDDNLVAGNIIVDAHGVMQYGIEEDATASGNVIYGNRIGGWATARESLVSTTVLDAPMGIQIGGTGSANKMRIYEEGTFTPVVRGTSTSGSASYTNQVGSYSRIGNRVFFELRVDWSGHTGTGDMLVDDLPYNAGRDAAVAIRLSGIALPRDNVMGYVVSGANHIAIQAYADSTSSTSNVAMDAAGGLMISGNYRIA